MSAGPLGRLEPTDFTHVDKYPLRGLPAAERPARTPVVIGVNWYSAFDTPTQDSRGRWWVARDGNLGRIRGGHAVVLPPAGVDEPLSWWDWHDQVSEGICVSEAVVRCMALLNRRRYQPRPLYDWAQDNDEWPGAEPDYDGTSVRAGLDCARTVGLVPARRSEPHYIRKGQVSRPPSPEHGIAANRWATDMDEVLTALGREDDDAIPFANSWGREYPRRVWMPVEVHARLLAEAGEYGLITDR